MKNISTCLFFVALMSLLCLSASGERHIVAPNDVTAIFPDPVPCCYNFPSSPDPSTDNGLQGMTTLAGSFGDATTTLHPLYQGGHLAASLAKGLELHAPMQFGTESRISFEETGIPTAFWVKDREMYYGQTT